MPATISTNAQLEAAYLANGGEAVVILEWNGCRLLGIVDDGFLSFAFCRFTTAHGWMCGAHWNERFVQAARSKFYRLAGTAER